MINKAIRTKRTIGKIREIHRKFNSAKNLFIMNTNFTSVEPDSVDVFGKHEFLNTKPWAAWPTIVVLSLASCVGTVGNILTLLAIASNKSVRNVESIFIVNLAISDLYVTTIADPMSILAKLEGEQFFAEVPGLCEVIAKLCTVSCVTSLLTIATMSLNRYMFVCHNILYKKIFSRRNSIIICIGVYCVGIAFVAMNFAGIGDHSFDKKSLECIWDRMADHPYTVVYSVTLVWIPCIVIGICYLRLYCFVSENKKKLLHHKIRSLAGSPASLVPQTSNLKLAKTFILIYVVFVTCWAPYALLIVIDYRDALTHEIHVYITVWAHLHPSINWLIYYLTQRKLAEAYRQILVCTISIMKTSRLDTDSSNEVCHQPNIVLRKSGVKIDPVCDSDYSKIPVGSLECLEKERENNISVNDKGKFRSSFSDGDIEKYIRISIREKTSHSTLDVHDRATMTEDTTTNSQEVKILMEIYKTIRGIQSMVTSHTLHTKHHVNGKLVGTDLGESSSIALL